MNPTARRIRNLTIAAVALAGSVVAIHLRAPAATLTPSSNPIPTTYFGQHVHYLVMPDTPNRRDLLPSTWPTVPVGAIRLWDAKVDWPHIEPARNEWHFAKLDAYLDQARSHGSEVLFTLAGRTPAWATVPGGEPNAKIDPEWRKGTLPNDADWAQWVTAVVRHCKGKVSAYELWNEPNVRGFWVPQNDSDLVRLARIAIPIIRREDPAALIATPAFTRSKGVAGLDRFLTGLGSLDIDIIAFHGYVWPGKPEGIVPLVAELRDMLTAHKLQNKPVWNTEMGWHLPLPFPSELGPAYVARTYLLNWASGVTRLYWYAWDNVRWVSLRMTDEAGTVSASGKAYGVVQKWLVGNKMESCQQAGQRWTCSLMHPNGSRGHVVWTEATPEEIAVPAEWRVQSVRTLDGATNPWHGATFKIGPEPVFLDSSSR